MSRFTTTARVPQSPDVAQFPGDAKLQQLREHAAQLEVRAHDLAVQRDQLRRRQDQAGDGRVRFDKPMADAEHAVTVAMVELRSAQSQLQQLEELQKLQEMRDLQPVTMVPPQREQLIGREQLLQIGSGAFVLMLPLVLALARRLWVRGARAVPAPDIEASPRLQRMEQAIESIAIEVERIGEAQRFATKLMSERQDPANRIGAALPRREPGTITPH